MVKIKVYLDNGATTRVDPEVVKTMLPYFSERYGNASSLHGLGQEASMAMDESRSVIAKKIRAKFDEIIFTSGGTEGDNLAIKGIAYANKTKGNHIITSKIEHSAILNACKQLEKEGFDVTYLNVDKEGFVDLGQLEKAITDKTILVSIMHVNNEIGVIQDIEKIGRICKEKNVLFHTDAVQSFCKVPIDVRKISIDLASFSAHKIHGPKGIGAFFVKKGTNIRKLIDGGPHEFGLRAGTENIPGMVGFAKAVKLFDKKEVAYVTKLRDKLIDGILKIPDVKLNGSREKRVCNNANFSFKAIEGEALGAYLDSKGICTATGSACTSRELKPSHVLMAMGLTPQEAQGSLRLTLGKFNTEKEIDYVLEILPKYVEKLRKMSPFWRKKIE